MESDGRSLVEKSLIARGISRRDFLKYCALVAGTLALPTSYGLRVAEALEKKSERLPVIWLELQDCAGCSESFTRAAKPSAADVVLDLISLNYHETLMATAGTQAEKLREDTIKVGGYLVIVEGAIPSSEGGIYCTIGGKTAEQILHDTVKNAIAVVSVGSCSSFGGLPKTYPNPTGAKRVMDLVKDKPILNLPGCPVNAVNITATLVHFLTFGKLPAIDDKLHRPLFAYGSLIHNNCPRRGHFNRGKFVREWGDEGHKKGWCLYKMGCKGPVTFSNCPLVKWNDSVSWPIGSGHGCIGCTEPDFWDHPLYMPVKIQEVSPPAFYPAVGVETEKPIDATSVAVTGAIAGAILGAVGAAAVTKNRHSKDGNGQSSGES